MLKLPINENFCHIEYENLLKVYLAQRLNFKLILKLIKMKKNLVLLLIAGVLSQINLQAQDGQKLGPQIDFAEKHINMGTIKEDDGAVEFTYTFKNTGTAPLKLENVKPSCGCTASEWTKDEVMPGKSGSIKAKFDPSYKKGKQHKSITVYSNTEPNITILSFECVVDPHVPTVLDTYKTAIGNLRFAETYINFGQVTNEKTAAEKAIKIYNQGDKVITINGLRTVKNTKYIKAKNDKLVIRPKERVEYTLLYDATQVNDFSYVFDEIKLLTDEKDYEEKTLNVIAEIKLFVPELSPVDKMKAPKISFDVVNHDFGNIKQGETVTHNFVFKNNGKQDLKILKVKTTCGCTASEPEKSVLKPGESSNIKVTYNSAGKKGRDEKTVTVYSNDPESPESQLKIVSTVEVPDGK